MSKTRKKSKIWQIVITVSLVLLALMTIGIGVKVADSEKTKTLTNFNYELGAISPTGEVDLKSEQSIVTKDFLNYDSDFVIDCAKDLEDMNSTYQVFFYDEDEKFLDSSAEYDYSWSDVKADSDNELVPEGTKFVKVVITPKVEEDEEISLNWLKARDYTKQYTITYTK